MGIERSWHSGSSCHPSQHISGWCGCLQGQSLGSGVSGYFVNVAPTDPAPQTHPPAVSLCEQHLGAGWWCKPVRSGSEPWFATVACGVPTDPGLLGCGEPLHPWVCKLRSSPAGQGLLPSAWAHDLLPSLGQLVPGAPAPGIPLPSWTACIGR